MKNLAFILLSIIGFISCTKDPSANATPPTTSTPTSRDFNFVATDERGVQIITLTGNTFIIKFYQNNNLIYTARTNDLSKPSIPAGCCLHSFSISNFKDGAYMYEITDSLNLFGYCRDSIISKNHSWMTSANGTAIPWAQSNAAVLNGVQQKPTFTILNCTSKDTNNSGIYINVNVLSNVIHGQVAFYFYKNNKVSSDNSYNFAPLSPHGHIVSSSQTNVSDIFYDTLLEQGTSLHSGDSVYFAIYPASFGFSYNFDPFSKLDTLGYPQYTPIGTQRIVIPYKLH
ncbi:MAG TPA: hypothetical protein VNZ49_17570 [Bacteroidia bacterium]|jgi:hypothetical protein|nr:hypothetical protein [Bacteroidia bacterium]